MKLFILAWAMRDGENLVDSFTVSEDFDSLNGDYKSLLRNDALHSASIFGQCLKSTDYVTVKTELPTSAPLEKVGGSVNVDKIDVLKTKARLIAEDIDKLCDCMGGNWESLSELIGMSSSAIPDMFREINWHDHLKSTFDKLDGVYLYDAGFYETAFEAWVKDSLTCVSNDFGGLRGHSWGAIDSILGVAQDSIKAVMMDDVHACYLRDGVERSRSDVIELVGAE